VTPTPAEAAPADPTLTNDSIIQMTAAKVPDQVIVSQIRSAPTRFDLASGELIRLTQGGVSAVVIEAMRDPQGTATPAPEVAKSTPKSGKPKESAKADVAKAIPPPTKAAEKGTAEVKGAAPPPPPLPAQEVAAPVAVAAPVIPVAPPVAPPVASAGSRQVSIVDGRPFRVTLNADLPAAATQGTVLRFTVLEDVKVDDVVVITKGTQVTGEIAQAARKGVFGMGGGKATMRFTWVQTMDGVNHAIRALSARAGKNDPVRSVEAGAKPKSDAVAVVAGTEYIAYFDGAATVNAKR
jgi:hypothetical protein